MAQVKMNEAGMRLLQQQIKSKIEDRDKRFREQWGGEPEDSIRPHVHSAFAAIGIDLPETTVASYASAVSEKRPFEWRLS